MYSSRGGNSYGQQSYAGQSAYGQNLGSAYSGSSVGGNDAGSQLSLAAHHSSLIGGSQDADIGAYRAHSSAAAHYGGQYSSVYGSASLSGAQQVPAMSAKGAGSSALEGRSGYATAITESPKFASDYVSSSHGYGLKGDPLYSEKIADYPSIDRRQYGERQSMYMGRDLQTEPSGRYADATGFSHQYQPEMYDRIDQASLLRQEQLLKSQSLQSASLDGGARQADYLAARGATSRHPTQDVMSYGGRVDADLSMLSATSYSGQHAPSILGAAPQRNVDDIAYVKSLSNPGYGVSLPPGRDYAAGKGLHGTSLESDYPSSMLSRGGHPRIDERKDDRAGYLREFELREEERRREHLRSRDRDREKEKEREREREREREKERERERILERRDKGRERTRKRALESRRERTPPRVSKDRRGSSMTKEGRISRRESPRQDASHRRHSPVKEKRREYVCKVLSSSLVDVERDYLSIDKRYPRLFTSPEVSKVVVNWPKDNLKLSIHTPVSFEHDFVEEETVAAPKDSSSKISADEPVKSEHGSTVWNAKVILMSGLSRNALEDLSSEKIHDDRIPHICNLLRFAILKKDRSFMAIGGPWDSADGGNPSVDDSSLIQTALRYAKDVAQLDLQYCKQWNRFLEIHYDRVGKDGLFSHKEITILFVPDLSECLPSLETWRDQWLAHKKAVAVREHQLSLKKEKSRGKKEGLKDKEADTSKDLKRPDKSEKQKVSASSGQAVDIAQKEKDAKSKAAEKEGDGNDKKFEKKDGGETGEEGKNVEKKGQGETSGAQAAGGANSGKKKIIKKIIKKAAADKTANAETSASKQTGKLDAKDVGEKNKKSETTGQQDESSAGPTGVNKRKKVLKKVSMGKTAPEEAKVVQPEVKIEKELDCSEDKPKGDSDSTGSAQPRSGVTQKNAVKTVKKKIIKRVPKRKSTGVEATAQAVGKKKDGDKDEVVVQAGNETENMQKQLADADNQLSEVNKSEKKITKVKPKTPAAEKQDDVANSSKVEAKTEDKKYEKEAHEKTQSGAKMETEADKTKVSQTLKDQKVEKEKDGKGEPKSKSIKEMKENRKPEEPPRPGLILQTKWSKDSNLRSLSLSLESLLNYTDKDIEESTFELSLLAESLYEMLQYQMGCRLLTFLQMLRIKFVMKRNQRKRKRSDIHEKENGKNSPKKHLKTDELLVETKSTKSETSSAAQPGDEKTVAAQPGDEKTMAVQPDDEKTIAKEDTLVDHVDEKMEDETDEDEDPEEDPEEYEEMEDASPHPDSSNEKEEEGKTDVDDEPKKVNKNEDEAEGSPKEKMDAKAAETEPKSNKIKEAKVETERKEKPVVKEVAVNKELLQAFRFFDRNRVGYIRVEDMRLIIHSLGKFLSHRDVKELVQSALLESNTGRDDRILYYKLVRMADI